MEEKLALRFLRDPGETSAEEEADMLSERQKSLAGFKSESTLLACVCLRAAVPPALPLLPAFTPVVVIHPHRHAEIHESVCGAPPRVPGNGV